MTLLRNFCEVLVFLFVTLKFLYCDVEPILFFCCNFIIKFYVNVFPLLRHCYDVVMFFVTLSCYCSENQVSPLNH